jgi:hypothetical protein
MRGKAVVCVVALLMLSGCGATVRPPAPAGPSQVGHTGGTPSPRVSGQPEHVVVAIFENKSAADLIGNAKAPYLNGLLARSAVFTQAKAIGHPSQPNYVALFSGSTHGVTSDRCPTALTGPNLGRQLLDAGLNFTGYSENLPSPGFTGCTARGGYARKHNPWVDFDNVPASANQPYNAFPTDFAALPHVAFVVPNLCADMHDCAIESGDAWAKANLDAYLTWAESHHSLLVVTFDEDDGSPANQILTFFAGGGVRAGRYSEPVDHYRVLRTIEDRFGLPGIGEAAGTTPITDCWD